MSSSAEFQNCLLLKSSGSWQAFKGSNNGWKVLVE
eukprot:CAMPEP_0202433396 /NCGR_PEP_ID=MMETSP1345-20130828/12372_1 /ASSEMBLY_ACC=CAM_ASM_000843 /TAXON_ID=342563 /ORGANISM="Fabrea Fabrea salina" /LENGTH=34 /DNA_ID= /DNA_START= /DNA_END= /DNA_ORIENTATION=